VGHAIAPFGRKLQLTGCLCQSRYLHLQALQHYGYVVDGQLHLFVVADIGLRDQVFDLARTNPRQDAQLAIIAFELPGFSAFAQAA
jgi:hypothetical protein